MKKCRSHWTLSGLVDVLSQMDLLLASGTSPSPWYSSYANFFHDGDNLTRDKLNRQQNWCLCQYIFRQPFQIECLRTLHHSTSPITRPPSVSCISIWGPKISVKVWSKKRINSITTIHLWEIKMRGSWDVDGHLSGMKELHWRNVCPSLTKDGDSKRNQETETEEYNWRIKCPEQHCNSNMP